MATAEETSMDEIAYTDVLKTYPNPAETETTISINLPAPATLTLE